jgi:hypothetical protein
MITIFFSLFESLIFMHYFLCQHITTNYLCDFKSDCDKNQTLLII